VGEGYKERVKEGEYSGNIMYLCMKMERRDLLNYPEEAGSGQGG
jgi:hypothetical protein